LLLLFAVKWYICPPNGSPCSPSFFNMENYKFLYVFSHFKEWERNAFLLYVTHTKGKVTKALRVCEALCAHTTAELLAAREDLNALDIPKDIFEDAQGNPKENIHNDLVNALSELFKLLPPFVLSENPNHQSWESPLRWITFLEKCGLRKEAIRLLKDLYSDVVKSGTTIKSLKDVQAALSITQKYRDYLFMVPDKHSIDDINVCLMFISDLIEIVKFKADIDRANLIGLLKQPTIEKGSGETVDNLEAGVKIEVPLKELYQEIHGALIKQDITHYYRAKELFRQYALALDPGEMQLALRYLLNSGTKLLRLSQKTEQEVAEEVFNLYKNAEESGLLAQKGVLATGLLFNMINAAAQVGEFKWANDIYIKYCGIYSDDSQYKMSRLKDAIFAFEKKDYMRVIDEINKIQYSFEYDIIRAKALLLCAAYEIKDKDLLREQQRSLNEFFKNRGKTPAYEGAENLAEILNLMIKQKAKKEVENKINEKKVIHKKEWVIEKLQKYKGKGD